MRSTILLGLLAALLAASAIPAAAQDYRQVTGVLRYADPGTGTTEFHPIQSVQVVVRPVTFPWYAKTVTTGWSGSFSAVFPAWLLPSGSRVRVEFMARNHAADVYVDLDGADEWVTWSYLATVPSGTGAVPASATVSTANLSAHFNIADMMRLGRSYASWHRGDDDDITKACVQYPDAEWSHFDSDWHEITLAGPPWVGTDGTYGGNEDDHGFRDDVILHEYAHHLAHAISDHDSPGGDHFSWTDNGYDFAWSEGFSTYFAHAVGLAFGQVAFTPGVAIEPIPRITMADQADGAPYLLTAKYPSGSEAMTQSSLWDLCDAAGEPHDKVGGSLAIQRTIFQIFDREIDEAETLDGQDIPRNILGFHEAWEQRTDEASHAALDQILFAHDIFPHGRQDYSVDSVAASKTVVEPGESVTLTVELRRSNGLYGGMPVAVKLQLFRWTYEGGKLVPWTYTLKTVAWNPLAGSTLVVPIQMPMSVNAATYRIRAIVDPENRVAESNESNNSRNSLSTIELETLFNNPDYDPWAGGSDTSRSSGEEEEVPVIK